MQTVTQDVLGKIFYPLAPTLRAIAPLRLVCKAWRNCIGQNQTLAQAINSRRIFPLLNVSMNVLRVAESVTLSTITSASFPASFRDDVQLASDLCFWDGKAYYQEGEKRVAVYDPQTGKTKAHRFDGPCRLAASPFCFVRKEDKILIYDLIKEQFSHLIRTPSREARLIATVDDYLVLFSEKTGKLYLAKTSDESFQELPFGAQNVQHVQSVEGHLLFILKDPLIDRDHFIGVVYDLAQKNASQPYQLDHSSISKVYHPDLHLAKILSKDFVAVRTNARLWEILKQGMPISPFGVKCCHAGDGVLFTVDAQNRLCAYNCETLDLIRAHSLRDANVIHVGQLYQEFVFTIEAQGSLCVWNMETGQMLKQIEIPGGQKFEQRVAVKKGKLFLYTGFGEKDKKARKVIIHDFSSLCSS